MASPLTGSLLTATTPDQDPGNPPMTGDCQHPDTASSPGVLTSELGEDLGLDWRFSDFLTVSSRNLSSDLDRK